MMIAHVTRDNFMESRENDFLEMRIPRQVMA